MKGAICLVLLLCLSAIMAEPVLNTKCLMACPRNLDPVCGTNGVTYPNSCSMQSMLCLEGTTTSVHVAHHGAC